MYNIYQVWTKHFRLQQIGRREDKVDTYRTFSIKRLQICNMPLETDIDLRNQMYEDWGIRAIYSDAIIEKIKYHLVTTYNGGYFYILDGRAIELQKAIETDIYIYIYINLTYSRWTSSLPSCLWSPRIFPSLPGSRLTIFIAMQVQHFYNSSTNG